MSEAPMYPGERIAFALDSMRNEFGARWKCELRHCWESGHYGRRGDSTYNHQDVLQRWRNGKSGPQLFKVTNAVLDQWIAEARTKPALYPKP